jgi:hypothetical protein
MKGRLVLALVLLALFSTVETNATQPSSLKCERKNAFLPDMATSKPLGVKILDRPVKTDLHHCHHEWTAHGTCCDQHDLLAYYRLEGIMMDHSEVNLVKAFEEMRKAIEKTTDTLVITPEKSSATANASQHLKEYKGINSFANFAQDSKRCWSSMKKVRGSALCSICSGRSEHYFLKEKILVTKEVCGTVVEDCEMFFLKLWKIIKKFPEVVDSYRKIQRFREELEDVEIMKKDLDLYSPPRELLDAFAEYEEMKRQKYSASTMAARICSMILNIRKKPYIMEMNPEQIEAVANATQAQAERRFKETMENLSKLDEKQKEELEAEYKKELQAVDLREKEEVAKIKKTVKQFIYRNKSMPVKTCYQFGERKADGARQCLNMTTKYENVRTVTPTEEFTKRMKAATNQAQNEKDEAKIKLEEKIRKIAEVARRRSSDVENDHKQVISKVLDEKEENLKRYHESQKLKLMRKSRSMSLSDRFVPILGNSGISRIKHTPARNSYLNLWNSASLSRSLISLAPSTNQNAIFISDSLVYVKNEDSLQDQNAIVLSTQGINPNDTFYKVINTTMYFP